MSGQEPSYAYNASAIGLGGVIRKGKRTTVLPTVASVCLASAGGEATNVVDNYFRDDISFTRAQTRVSGYSTAIKGNLHGRRFFTYADVMLTNLQVFDRLKINFMQATVTSTREVAGDRDAVDELAPDQSRFTIRVFYHGIELDGDDVQPDVDVELCHSGSYADFVKLLSERDDLPEETRKLIDSVKGSAEKNELAKNGLSNRPAINGPLLRMHGRDNAKGNKVDLPMFGRARFGEALVKPDRQRISLLRLNLDSDWVKKPLKSKTEGEEILVLRDAVVAGDEPPIAGVAAFSDGLGGNLSSGDSGSNGVPIWP